VDKGEKSSILAKN